MYSVQWFNIICGLGKGPGKCSHSTYKKVVAHLQVPVSVKQKYKLPNLLGNKYKQKSGFNFNYYVLEVGFGYGFSKKWCFIVYHLMAVNCSTRIKKNGKSTIPLPGSPSSCFF